jgi:hypothetical protein
MLEEITENKKRIIDERAKKDKNKVNFISNIFRENSEIMEKYIKEKGISLKEGYEQLQTILSCLRTDLYLEKGGKSFQLKEIYNLLPVKLGWYERLDKRDLDPEMYIEQCTLTPTNKSIQVEKAYRKSY